MTILEACLKVLEGSIAPMSADQIMARIKDDQLYEFKAEDPLAVLRATLRKHIRTALQPRVREVSKGQYLRA